MKYLCLLLLLLASEVNCAPLTVLSSNPQFFTADGVHALYLSGSHNWSTLQDWGTSGSPQAQSFTAFVSMLSSNGQNFTFLWRTELPKFCNLPSTASSPPDFTVAQHPWSRTGPGNADDGGLKFDLTSFDQSFFDRLRARVIALQDAGIYVGVYLFTGEWIDDFRCTGDGYPLSSANNINSISDGGGTGSYTMSSTNSITAIQDALIDKYVDTLNDLDNVIWIISEEAPSTSTWWQGHAISHLRTYEAGKTYQHPIGIAVLGDNSDTFITNSNADWVAPFQKIVTTICGSGTPTCKVVIADSDHSYFGMWNDTQQQNRNWLWENFMNGNSTAFMDPYLLYYPRESRNVCGSPTNGICSSVDTRWNNLRANLGATVSYSKKVDLANLTPQSSLCSTTYCLAKSGSGEFLVYQPSTGAFTVTVATKVYQYEWYNPATNAIDSSGTVQGTAGDQTFTPPFSGDAVLWLKEYQPLVAHGKKICQSPLARPIHADITGRDRCGCGTAVRCK